MEASGGEAPPIGISNDEPFDFETHGRDAVSEYLKVRDFYANLAHAAERIIVECLRSRNVRVNSVSSRAKAPESFERKAASPSILDPTVPKYNDPLRQVFDLAGIRIMTLFPTTLDDVDVMIHSEFEILERSDKGEELIAQERFGYRSIHYIARFNGNRVEMPEYSVFREAMFEIQVRTVLQHAWAEIEHDIQYKSALVLPTEIRRRFMVLAGLLELADREFQQIQILYDEVIAAGRARIERGDLSVEITPDSVKAYLDRKFGTDRRIARASYEWVARLLRVLSFDSLAQVDECVRDYDDAVVSGVATGYRAGPITRFQDLLLAGMGRIFIERHPDANEPWFQDRCENILARLTERGLSPGAFDPRELEDVRE